MIAAKMIPIKSFQGHACKKLIGSDYEWSAERAANAESTISTTLNGTCPYHAAVSTAGIDLCPKGEPAFVGSKLRAHRECILSGVMESGGAYRRDSFYYTPAELGRV